MGRPEKQIDDSTLLQMRGEGKTLKQISEAMGVSIPTLSRRFAVLNHAGLFTKYRQIQGLQLTELQARLMAAIDIDHIESASVADIANACYVIEKAKIAIQGKESGKMRGLVDHLQALEAGIFCIVSHLKAEAGDAI